MPTYTDRHHLGNVRLFMGDSKGTHACKQLVGDNERVTGFSVGEQDGKFFSLISSSQICRTVENRFEALGYLLDAGITGKTTVARIEAFELVNVAKQERKWGPCFLCIEPSPVELPFEMMSVGNAC